MKYFTLKEMVRTSHSENNFPQTWEHVTNLMKMAQLLDRIREDYGAPVIVSSGYRNVEVNKAVGGVPNSWHLYGLAADIMVEYIPANDFKWRMADLCKVVKRYESELEEAIYKPNYIHIALKL